MTSKGQITIPKSVRDRLHLHPGDRVAFVIQGDDQALLKPLNRSVEQVFGILARPGTKVRSLKHMDEAIGGRARRHKS